MSGKGQMRLGAFFNPTGHHVASWRHPRAQADAGINFAHYLEITRTAERGKFDMVFLADNLGVRQAHMEALSRSAQYIANFEPLTLLSALATHTTHIGLVATASTSYNEPFHVARKFASLDHLSGGRAGWNLVTSGQENEARNFSREKHYEHGERYDRAREFARVVLGLWDTWDDDAFVRDKETGQFFHPDKLHDLNHRGEHFSVLGALNIPRSPQGHPVIVQAGGSDDMIAVAAEFAEVIFCAPLTLEAAQKFYATLKGRLAAYGRSPDEMKIMPGLELRHRPHRCRGGGELRVSQRAHPSHRGARNPVDGARQCRSVAVSVRRPAAGEPAALERQPEHFRKCHRDGAPRKAFHPPGRDARRRRPRQGGDPRLAANHRRLHGRMVPQRRLRRLQYHAAVPAGRARRFCRTGDPGIAAARPVPHRIRRQDLARKSRPQASAQAATPSRAQQPRAASGG